MYLRYNSTFTIGILTVKVESCLKLLLLMNVVYSLAILVSVPHSLATSLPHPITPLPRPSLRPSLTSPPHPISPHSLVPHFLVSLLPFLSFPHPTSLICSVPHPLSSSSPLSLFPLSLISLPHLSLTAWKAAT